MARMRVLSLLTLMASLYILHWGVNAFGVSEPELWKILGGIAAIAGGFFTVSALMIFLLSLFALAAEPDGSFVINDESLYGRIFLTVSRLGEAASDEFGYCRTFWQTNLALAVGAYLMAMCVVLFILFYENGLNFLLIMGGGILCFGLLRLVVWGVVTASEKVSEKFPFVESSELGITTGALLILGIIALLYYTLGIMGILWVLLFVVALFGAVGLFVLICLAANWFFVKFSQNFSRTQFGVSLKAVYYRYFCPRLRVKH